MSALILGFLNFVGQIAIDVTGDLVRNIFSLISRLILPW
jgi:hypothetical protein